MTSREWFTSKTDDVLVGRFRCIAVPSTEDFRKLYPQNETAVNAHCLNLAFKVDREMNLNGKVLEEKYSRVVSFENRRNYDIRSEQQNHERNMNKMAYSLSHAPTCMQDMHRYVESCGILMCDNVGDSIEWGQNDAGMKAIVCNNADKALLIGTTVIGNYPRNPKCSEKGKSYDDEVPFFNILQLCMYLGTLCSGSHSFAEKTMLEYC